MSYKFSDAEMLIATQIAYLDAPGKNQTVGSIIDRILNEYARKDANGNYCPNEWLGEKELAQFNTAKDLQDIINKNGAENCYNWKVVDYCDKNDSTGFYGCMIDDGKGNAILGYRGSESYDLGQKAKDWLEADFGLLNNELTKQQKDASDFTRKMYEKHGDKYDSYSLSGHSLGGNLAEHSSMTAPEGMKGKIDHAINFDGPGFSNEYINAHKKDIEKSNGCIDHYQWSLVGTLLYPIERTFHTIKAHDDEGKEGLSGMIWRHATKNVELIDGQAQEDEQRDFEKNIGDLSRKIDGIGTDGLMLLGYPFLSVLGPEVPVIIYGMTKSNEVIGKIRNILDMTERELHELWNKWTKEIQGYHDKIAYAGISGEFYVNQNSLNSMAATLENASNKIKRVSGEIEQVRKSLNYFSVSGNYYRANLFSLNNRIYRSANNVSQCGKAAAEATVIYHRDDTAVAQKYRGL